MGLGDSAWEVDAGDPTAAMVVNGLIEGSYFHGADAFGEEIDEGDELSADVVRTGVIQV